MSTIDEIFKQRGLKPTNGAKRKLDSQPSAAEAYKAAKITANGDAKGHTHAASVQDEPEEDDAGPALPPDQDEGYDEDDEEGRFFGDGMDRHTATVLDYIEGQDGGGDGNQDEAPIPENIDSAWLKKTHANLQRRVDKNAELRAKYEDTPAKFMESEGDLDAELKVLSLLSEHPELYEELVELGGMTLIVSLLGHENADIAINAIQILAELTDEDVNADPKDLRAIVDAMLQDEVPDLLASNMERLDEANEEDRNGIYHCLSLLEHLMAQSYAVDRVIQAGEPLLKWLVARVQAEEKIPSQNKLYAAEVLASALQSSSRARASLLNVEAVDTLLSLIAPYRYTDPAPHTGNEELMADLVTALACLVRTTPGKHQFRESEGVELARILLKSTGKQGHAAALRLLDFALSRAPPGVGDAADFKGAANGKPKSKSKNKSGDKVTDDADAALQEPQLLCERLVEQEGLKPLFAALMKRNTDDKGAGRRSANAEHAVGIIASLLRFLPGGSAPRIRTLAKCVEKQYQVVTRLVKMRRHLLTRLAEAEAAAGEDEDEDERMARRLEAGLAQFQTVDVVLAWLAAEDSGARDALIARLAEGGRDESIADLRATMTEQLADLRKETGNDADPDAAEMLSTLIDVLE